MSKVVKIHGVNAVASAIEQDPVNVICVYVSAKRQDKRIADLVKQAQRIGLKVKSSGPAELERLAKTERHQGLVAEYRQPESMSEEDLLAKLDGSEKPCLLVVLDCVQDPHNLGACLRSAAAAGVDAVIIPKDKSASVTATVRKASAGTADRIPLVQVANLSRCLEKLKSQGVWVFGATAATDQYYFQSDLTGSCAIVLGGEGGGMRRLTEAQCDHLIKIPMASDVESLNVSVACGVLLFEAMRQRMAL